MRSTQEIAREIEIDEEKIMGQPTKSEEVVQIVKRVSAEAIKRGDEQWREVNI